METNELESTIEAILFAAGESVPAERIAQVLMTEVETVYEAAERLAASYAFDRRGLRLIRVEESLQIVSAPEFAPVIRSVLEMRKAPQLSQSAMEALAVVAYFQPVTRAYVDQVRGVDSSYTMSILQERGLIEACGRLQVPGRPVLYKTTKTFLRCFGIESPDQLPPLEDLNDDALMGQVTLEKAIAELTDSGDKQL